MILFRIIGHNYTEDRIMLSLIIKAIILFSLQWNSYGRSVIENAELPVNVFYPEDDTNEVVPISESVPLSEVNPLLDSELQDLSYTLAEILQRPWGPEGVPLIYIEDQQQQGPHDNNLGPDRAVKRSRYYRRYPWKRQNSRSRTYEADNRYLCQPSREDVFKLLVAIHETRAGNGGKSINFCNRRRSAGSVFTNIRFLGKRK